MVLDITQLTVGVTLLPIASNVKQANIINTRGLQCVLNAYGLPIIGQPPLLVVQAWIVVDAHQDIQGQRVQAALLASINQARGLPLALIALLAHMANMSPSHLFRVLHAQATQNRRLDQAVSRRARAMLGMRGVISAVMRAPVAHTQDLPANNARLAQRRVVLL